MMKFTIGQEVRLKSGGPRMIIEDILSDDLYICTYIHNLAEFKKEIFHAEKLETAERLKYCPSILIE
jgi:uncharacterized protein YodC (DUF2158 family)